MVKEETNFKEELDNRETGLRRKIKELGPDTFRINKAKVLEMLSDKLGLVGAEKEDGFYNLSSLIALKDEKLSSWIVYFDIEQNQYLSEAEYENHPNPLAIKTKDTQDDLRKNYYDNDNLFIDRAFIRIEIIVEVFKEIVKESLLKSIPGGEAESIESACNHELTSQRVLTKHFNSLIRVLHSIGIRNVTEYELETLKDAAMDFDIWAYHSGENKIDQLKPLVSGKEAISIRSQAMSKIIESVKPYRRLDHDIYLTDEAKPLFQQEMWRCVIEESQYSFAQDAQKTLRGHEVAFIATEYLTRKLPLEADYFFDKYRDKLSLYFIEEKNSSNKELTQRKKDLKEVIKNNRVAKEKAEKQIREFNGQINSQVSFLSRAAIGNAHQLNLSLAKEKNIDFDELNAQDRYSAKSDEEIKRSLISSINTSIIRELNTIDKISLLNLDLTQVDNLTKAIILLGEDQININEAANNSFQWQSKNISFFVNKPKNK